MKRIEMIKLIMLHIPGGWNGRQAAEDTLQAIEEAGMLPPPIEIEEEEIDESCYTVTSDGEVCKWEEE